MSLTRIAALISAVAVLGLGIPAWADETATAPPADAAQPAATPPPSDAAPAADVPPADAPPADAPPAAAPSETAPPAPAPVAEAPRSYTVQPPSAGLGAAPPGMAQVVFFRPNRFVGMALSFTVREGELELGQLANGRYFVLAVPPGEHTYAVRSEATDRLTMEVEAGETYYVQHSIEMGVVVGRPNLAPSDQATFQRHLRGMRVSTWRSRQPNSPAAEGAPAAPTSSTVAAPES